MKRKSQRAILLEISDRCAELSALIAKLTPQNRDRLTANVTLQLKAWNAAAKTLRPDDIRPDP